MSSLCHRKWTTGCLASEQRFYQSSPLRWVHRSTALTRGQARLPPPPLCSHLLPPPPTGLCSRHTGRATPSGPPHSCCLLACARAAPLPSFPLYLMNPRSSFNTQPPPPREVFPAPSGSSVRPSCSVALCRRPLLSFTAMYRTSDCTVINLLCICFPYKSESFKKEISS